MVTDGEPPDLAYVIDDDRALRVSLSVLLRTMETDTRPFSCAEDFLEELPHLRPGCLVVDIAMPGKDGLTLLADLRDCGCDWPVIIMTGHGEVKSAVRAMKLGAIEFLEKPFSDNELQDALTRGFEWLRKKQLTERSANQCKLSFEAVRPRERDVLNLIIEGLPNKLIAHRLSLSIRTVEMHRARLMKRVGAANSAELVRLASVAGVLPSAESISERAPSS